MSSRLIANQSQFQFRVASFPDDAFTVQRFTNHHEALSQHYSYEIECWSQSQLDLSGLVGQRAKLMLIWPPDAAYIHGTIASCENVGVSQDGFWYCYQLRLVSLLENLRKQQHARVFIKQTIVDIIREVLITAGWPASTFVFKTQQPYPEREITIQLNETDLAFIERWLSFYGLFYYFDQQADNSTLIILDNNQNLPQFTDQSLPFQTESGADKPVSSIYQFSERAQIFPQTVQLKNYYYPTPDIDLIAQANNTTENPSDGINYIYGIPYHTTTAGDALAQLRIQALDWQRQTFIAQTDCRGLQVGQIVKLTNHPNSDYNTSYYVVAIDRTGNQKTGLALADENIKIHPKTYQAKLLLAKLIYPFRAMPHEMPAFYSILPAIIESLSDGQPYLDDQGRYHARLIFDQQNPLAQASCPLRLLQPYGGAITNGQAVGMHFPLRAGTQVAVGFVNDNLDEPVIIGVIYNPTNPSTVNAQNCTQNVVRTFLGNEFLMEDQPANPFTQFATQNRQNLMSLNATPEQHQINLTTQQGSLNVYANKTLQTQTGDSYIQNTGGDHITTVQNNQQLMTQTANITQQSGNDLSLMAGRNLQIHAAGAINLQSAKDIQLIANNNLSAQIMSGDLQMQTSQGDMQLQAAQNLSILGSGAGRVTIGQPAGGMVFTSSGSVLLSGPNATFEAPQINVYGKGVVNSSSGPKYQAPQQLQTSQNKSKNKKKKIKFLVDSSLSMNAKVNHQNPKDLPTKQVYSYELENNQHQGPVTLNLNNNDYTLIPDLATFYPNLDQEWKVYLGELDLQKDTNQSGELQLNTALVMLQAQWGVSNPVSDGFYNVESVDHSTLNWLLEQVTGGDVPPLLKDLTKIALDPNKRAFLKEYIKGGQYKIKNLNGHAYIIFKGDNRAREFITGTRYRLNNNKVSLISTYAKAASFNAEEMIESIKEGAGDNMMSFVIVGTLDIGKYYFSDDKNKELSDLLVQLGIDFANAMIAGYAGILFAGTAIVVGALLGGIPALVVVAAGIAFTFFIGHELNRAEDHYDITKYLKSQGRKVEGFMRNEA